MSTFSAKHFGVNVSDLYLPYDRGMVPAIQQTVSAVKELSPEAACILDLGSGPGEPACTLAQAFPGAAVICSDVAQEMIDLAGKRAESEGLANVRTMLLDLANLSAIPSASQDVVTANFAIMATPNVDVALKEMHRVLKPTGHLVGTVWQAFSIPGLCREVMTELLGEPPAPPQVDSMRFADCELLDKAFEGAGFRMIDGHNALGKILFDLGPLAGESHWMSVMIAGLAKLEELQAAGDMTICGRAKAAVEQAASAKGFVRDGKLACPGTFRAFRLAKS